MYLTVTFIFLSSGQAPLPPVKKKRKHKNAKRKQRSTYQQNIKSYFFKSPVFDVYVSDDNRITITTRRVTGKIVF